jgi:CTD small phosphatase-like protein 2
MHKHYEIVVFTAGLKDYADWILNDLDKQLYVKFRLYRDSCRFRQGAYVKDLSLLGRDLSKTIIIDNIADNYQL